jgi:uncharacterized membrane protein
MKSNRKQASRRDHRAIFKNEIKLEKKWYDRAADFMTEVFGTVGFLVINILFFIAWILINLNFFPSIPAFDPYPFNFLTMFVSLEAIILSVIVLVSQNKASKIADLRQELDFQIDVHAEREITRIIKMLEGIHNHLGMKPEHDSELKAMEEEINIEKLEKEIKNRGN